MSSLSIENIHKKFNDVTVLNDINISIDKGDFLVLVGPSGCGKSTLLNIIAGLEQPTSGDVKIAGEVVTDVHPAMRDIAMVFQSYALYPNMDVYHNMSFGLEMHKVPKAERHARVAEAAETLQIENLLDRKPAALSGGQRQRVAMGRALVRRPQIFLFDEPLSNLDAKLRVDMRTEIKRLHQKFDATIVYVTHDQIEAMTLSTKIAVMNQGIIQQFGKASDIYDTPQNIFVATFMGSPAMNIFDGSINKSGKFESAGLSCGLPKAASKYKGQEVTLGIRPENFTVSDKKTGNIIPAEIDLIEPTGADSFVILSLPKKGGGGGGGGGFTMRADNVFQKKYKKGDTINLHVSETHIHLFDSRSGERLQF